MTRAPRQPQALIVSRNHDTMASLERYFADRGVEVTIADDLETPVTASESTAIVVFPDEFPAQSSIIFVRKLADQLPRTVIVVVTRATARFDSLSESVNRDGRRRLFVLPRPAWGWALLDHVLDAATNPSV